MCDGTCQCCQKHRAFARAVIDVVADLDARVIGAARDAGLVDRPPADDEETPDDAETAPDVPAVNADARLGRLAALLAGGPQSVGRLAAALGLPEGTCRQLVRRHPDHFRSRKGQGVSLTDEGRVALLGVPPP